MELGFQEYQGVGNRPASASCHPCQEEYQEWAVATVMPPALVGLSGRHALCSAQGTGYS